jgi:stringent starvation protein B
MEKTLTPTRPYLLRAMHDWMSDNNQTPLIVVDASVTGVNVPEQHVQDGRIILNVSWSATEGLVLENEQVSFAARFSGASRQVVVPMDAIRGIYARESGQGMMFQDEPGANDLSSAEKSGDDNGDDNNSGGRPPKNRGGLRVVK